MKKLGDAPLASDFQRAFEIEARVGRYRDVLPTVNDPVEVIDAPFMTADEMRNWTPDGDNNDGP